MPGYQSELENALKGLPLQAVKYFPSIDSTNAEARRWARQGAPHLALVIADEQTAGRGRLGRSWYTPPGAALAFTIILRPDAIPVTQPAFFNLYTALGALATVQALDQEYALPAQIKWPNDVLLAGKKVAGVLVEAQWMLTSESPGQLQSILVGIGVNVTQAAIPPDAELRFPATCIEAVLGRLVERAELLRYILAHLVDWLPRLPAQAFLDAWEGYLAWKGEQVQVIELDDAISCEGIIQGLAPDGALWIATASGETRAIHVGEVHLRKVAS